MSYSTAGAASTVPTSGEMARGARAVTWRDHLPLIIRIAGFVIAGALLFVAIRAAAFSSTVRPECGLSGGSVVCTYANPESHIVRGECGFVFVHCPGFHVEGPEFCGGKLSAHSSEQFSFHSAVLAGVAEAGQCWHEWVRTGL